MITTFPPQKLGASYTEVSTYAELPTPSSYNADKVYIVKTATGSMTLTIGGDMYVVATGVVGATGTVLITDSGLVALSEYILVKKANYNNINARITQVKQMILADEADIAYAMLGVGCYSTLENIQYVA